MKDKFNFTWGMAQETLNEMGYIQVTVFMLRNYTKLGLTKEEFFCLVHLASYHYNTPQGQASPSISTIAGEMGYKHPNSVRYLIRSLETKRMLVVTRMPGCPSIYDAGPFAQAALELWKTTPTMGCRGQNETPTTHCSPPLQPIVAEEKKKKKRERKSSSQEGESVMGKSQVDPLAFELERRTAQAHNWAVPLEAGGDDAWNDGPVDSFARLVGLNPADLPKKKRQTWATSLKETAIQWSTDQYLITAEAMTKGIDALIESRYGWKTFSSPYEDGFKNAIGIVLLGGGQPQERGRAMSLATYKPPTGIEVRH